MSQIPKLNPDLLPPPGSSAHLGAQSLTHPDLLPTKEAAAYIGAKPQSLASARCTRTGSFAKIPYLKLGFKKVLYRRNDLDAWLESQLVNPATVPAQPKGQRP